MAGHVILFGYQEILEVGIEEERQLDDNPENFLGYSVLRRQ